MTLVMLWLFLKHIIILTEWNVSKRKRREMFLIECSVITDWYTWFVVWSSFLTVCTKRACLANTLALCSRENWLGVVGARSTLAGIKLFKVLQQGLPQVSPLCGSTWNPPNQIYDGKGLDKQTHMKATSAFCSLITLISLFIYLFLMLDWRHFSGVWFYLAFDHGRVFENGLGPVLVGFSVRSRALPFPG